MPMSRPAGFVSGFYDPTKNPSAPTNVSASAAEAEATVSFTAPIDGDVGGSAITAYYVVSNPGQITVTGSSSPITVTGLTNGTPYTFNVWALNSYGPGAWSAATGSVTPAVARGLFPAGYVYTSGQTNNINVITINTTGNATSFGDVSATARYGMAACASSTTAVIVGGLITSASLAQMYQATIASSGSAQFFGNLSQSVYQAAGCGSSTRGVFGGGSSSGSDTSTIQYVTYASLGNAQSFGNLATAVGTLASCSSPTRGLFSSPVYIGPNYSSALNYITIATTGNSTSFGNLTQGSYYAAGCSSSTRGLFGGGNTGSYTANIDYVTIATLGNASSFGSLTQSRGQLGACSSTTRGVWAGGLNSGSSVWNIIDYVTIATTGNATDFGDLTSTKYLFPGCSNANGGLQ